MKRQVNRIPIDEFGGVQVVPPFEIEDTGESSGFQIFDPFDDESQDAD